MVDISDYPGYNDDEYIHHTRKLDLRKLVNLNALNQMDWRRCLELRKANPPLGLEEVFWRVVCNPESCPIGWYECQRCDWGMCHYYAILKDFWPSGSER